MTKHTPESRTLKSPRKRMAMALAYDPARDEAPRVVASGKGEIAEKILALAARNDIPVREDPDLAALLQAVEVGTEIPAEAFAAVAEIFGYLYRLNARLASPAGKDAADDPHQSSETLDEP